MHKSGFVNIIGLPNVGKSTLMNALIGEKMSIISRKPQTTRHRIIGICNGDDYQIVFSDTPGFISTPSYGMQIAMNSFAYSTFEDADIIVFLTELGQPVSLEPKLANKLQKAGVPRFLVVNKIDLIENSDSELLVSQWKELKLFDHYFCISALKKLGVDSIFKAILEQLPEGPEYYPKDQFTDKPERFFVSEIIRGNILKLYHQEIPYSVEIDIEEFKEVTKDKKPLVRIFAVIYVARKSQKSILIGKQGQAIKQLGIASRIEIEEFLDKKVFLELFVRVKENWRDQEYFLKKFGYQ